MDNSFFLGQDLQRTPQKDSAFKIAESLLPQQFSYSTPTEMAYGDVFSEKPVMFSGYELERLKSRLSNLITNCETQMQKIWTKARVSRKYYEVLKKDLLPYDNAPDLTLPITRSHSDGILAHIIEALDLKELYRFQPLTADAIPITSIYDMHLEHELSFSRNRQTLVTDTLMNSVITGTGIPYITFAEDENGEIHMLLKQIEIENFFTDRINVDTFTNSVVGRTFKLPLYQLEQMAIENKVDKYMIEKVKSFNGDNKMTLAETNNQFNEDFNREDDKIINLHEVYLRYQPLGVSGQPDYIRVIYHKPTRCVGWANMSEFREVFNAPPYGNIRLLRQPNAVFGTGIPDLARSIQEFGDDSFNAHIESQRFQNNPVILYNSNSPIKNALEGNLVPGLRLSQIGAVDVKRDIGILDLPKSTALTDVQLATSLADSFIISDGVLGGGGSRQTRSEFSARLNLGTVKLRLNLRSAAEDLVSFGELLWGTYNHFVIKQKGVQSVFGDSSSSKLLSYNEVPQEQITSSILELALAETQQRAMETQQQGLDMAFLIDTYIKIYQSIEPMLTNGGIPSSRRNDIKMSLSGNTIIANQIAESEVYKELAPFMQLIPAASQDIRWWNYLRRVFETSNIKDWEVLIGKEPQAMMDDASFNNVSESFSNTIAKSSVR
jgi:hypothetical protein